MPIVHRKGIYKNINDADVASYKRQGYEVVKKPEVKKQEPAKK